MTYEITLTAQETGEATTAEAQTMPALLAALVAELENQYGEGFHSDATNFAELLETFAELVRKHGDGENPAEASRFDFGDPEGNYTLTLAEK